MMNRLKNVMWWTQVVMACAVLGFCWIGMIAVDEWFVRDAVSREKIIILRAFASVGVVCIVVLVGISSFNFLFEKLASAPHNDTEDEEYEFDSVFPDSPTKPR